MRIRLNDTVEIITGNRSGVKGKVTKVLVGRNKLYVEGINIYKKTVRGSGIVDVQRPIDVSKVMLVCPHCTKRAKIGIKINNGKKERFCKKCNKVL
jgi:large subunit ribosomal protein L24